MRNRLICGMFCVLCITGTGTVLAQDETSDRGSLEGITTKGTIEVTLLANILQLEADLVGVGADADEALADANRLRLEFEKKFEAVKGDSGSLEFFTNWTYSTGRPGVVRVLLPIKASWNVPGKSAAEVREAAVILERKIRSADLGWPNADGDEDDRPQNRPGTATQVAATFRRGLQPMRGRAFIAYGSKISDEEYDQALTRAFEEARRQAKSAARAAGVELGAVRGLKASPLASPGRYLRSPMAGEMTEQISLEVNFDLKRSAD